MTSTKRIPKLTAILLALLLLVGGLFALTATEEAYAASLAKPTVSVTNASPTSVKVSWKAATGAKKYTVYYSTKKRGGFKAVKTTTGKSYTRSKLTCGKTYYFKVAAINGKKKAESKVLSVTAKPAAPTALNAAGNCCSVTLSWKKGSGVSGYEVAASTKEKSGFKAATTTTTATTYTQKKLAAGTARYYKVRAYKTVGKKKVWGAYSAVLCAQTTTTHNPAGSWSITQKATCAAEGLRSNTCADCGKTFTEVIPKDALTHKYTATDIPADNTNEAYKVYTCSVCGNSYTSKIKQHKYKDTVTASTCTKEGYTTHTCSSCGYSYVGEYTAVLPHTYEEKVLNAPTCTKEGTAQSVCKVCGIEGEKYSIAKLPHTYEEEVLLASTCSVQGSARQVCKDCGDTTDIYALPLAAHTYKATVTAPTCTAQGYTTYTCTACDDSYVADYTEMIPHTFATKTVPANCTEAGYQVEECTVCHYQDESTRVVLEPSMNAEHDYQAGEVVAPTCTAKGYTVYTCSRCQHSYHGDETDMIDHDYEASVTQPTCTKKGYTTYTCTVCKDSYVDPDSYTDIIDHDYEDAVTPATCTAQGYTTHTCKMCRYSYIDSVTERIAHDMQTTVIAPTCLNEGYTVSKCTMCGLENAETKTDAVAALGHLFGEEYTLNDNGYRVYTCTREGCEETMVDTTCYIDITNRTASLPALAVFGYSAGKTEGPYDKLDIYPDGVSEFEITGTTTGLTIDVNATCNTSIKLAGASITNDLKDCLNIKNKVAEGGTEPKVSVSAKDGTENNLIVTGATGNAIDAECELSLKGHGRLYAQSTATTLNIKAKMSIRNQTLEIRSGNRGIDTEKTITVTNPSTGVTGTEDEYYNIDIDLGATITITSYNDGIRCKNLETAAPEAEGETASTLTITATDGDGIQPEGKKGVLIHAGTVRIQAGKRAFNCESALITIDPGAVVDTTGSTAYSKDS